MDFHLNDNMLYNGNVLSVEMVYLFLIVTDVIDFVNTFGSTFGILTGGGAAGFGAGAGADVVLFDLPILTSQYF
jgi:hypothetical protein